MAEVHQHLEHLERHRLIYVTQLEPELEYLFRHALVQDAAYESLLKADRRKLHRAVGEMIEQLYQHRLEELASVLGHHFLAANDQERARRYLSRAGVHALAHYANAEAAAHFQVALGLGGDDAERAPLLRGLGDAFYGLAYFGK